MKYVFSFIFLLSFFGFKGFCQNTSSSKTSYKFNNTPILNISLLNFTDDNKNGLAEADEKCFLILQIINTGKSTASKVNLMINSSDSLNNYFSFEKNYLVGNILTGETKEIKIPLNASTSFENTEVNFEIVAREANNYDSPSKSISVPVKATDLSIAINWYNPIMPESNVTDTNYTVKACIISSVPVSSVSIYQNNSELQSARGFKTIKTDACSNYLEQNISLSPGSNIIQIRAKNKKLTVDSEIRNIILKDTEYEYRTALVIGNGKYEFSPLKNPANDAKSITKALRDLQFDVIEIIDGDLPKIREAIRNFHTKLSENKGVGLFYYAGHGIQLKGENYMIPINHDIKEEFEVEDQAVKVNTVLSAMEGTGTRMNIVILDACRDNPFARSMRSSQRGLAKIDAEGTGSIIAYATAPGSVAADGSGENGLYTQELLKAIKVPGLEIGMVFRTILTNVKRLSGNKQIPWTDSSIEGEFYFIK
ncbi:MAG: caspase family protein [Bacteroidales bacterium]